MKNILTLCFFAIAFLQNSFAQTIDTKKLDAYFSALEVANNFMGSIAISENGKIVYKKSIGYADMETRQKIDANTKFRIGSISKTFTAVMVLKAVEEKKLQLTQKISTYFPDVKNGNTITVAHLLNHRSGIHNITADSLYLTYNTNAKSMDEMVGIISDADSDFEPDSKAAYSNSNYILLSYILEKIYNKPYARLFSEKISKPLQLSNTMVGGPINFKNNECYSYSKDKDWVKETETDMSIPMGAGSVISTPSDLTKFADALFANKIISASSLALMQKMVEGFGMGLFVIPFNAYAGFGHTGGIDGFSSVFSHFNEKNISYALTSNGTDFENNNISIAALSAAYGLPFSMPNMYVVDEVILHSYEGVYASKEMPLKITVALEGNNITAQASGQSAFPLEAITDTKFQFTQAGIEIEFSQGGRDLILTQKGKSISFYKE